MGNKRFIDADMAGYIMNKIANGIPGLIEALDKYGVNPKDMIRFQMVSEMCRSEREKKDLTFKQIALRLKVPQYRLKDIESSSVKDINSDILECYVDYLDLRKWFNLWKKNNLDVYNRFRCLGKGKSAKRQKA